MEINEIVLIAVAAFAALAIILLFALAAISFNVAFGKRYDKNPLLKYFTAEDFSLEAKPVQTGKLCGYIYNTGCEKVVVFCHGMGAGHIAYTTEIAYLCNKGFTVLALDSLGCNLSQGKNIKGMYSGVETAIAAVKLAKENFPDKKIYLVGHSWGAYSALCASAHTKVNAVVAISPPDNPVKTMQEGAKPVIGKFLSALLKPFWYLLNFFKYGVKGNSSAAKCADKNGVPTLIIHGDCDRIVTVGKAAVYKSKKAEKLIVAGKGHNPYNTENAERLLAELNAMLRAGKIDPLFDFNAATEEDLSVMDEITSFISKN